MWSTQGIQYYLLFDVIISNHNIEHYFHFYLFSFMFKQLEKTIMIIAYQIHRAFVSDTYKTFSQQRKLQERMYPFYTFRTDKIHQVYTLLSTHLNEIRHIPRNNMYIHSLQIMYIDPIILIS